MIKCLCAAVLVLAACGPAHAGEQDIIGRLKRAGAQVTRLQLHREEDVLSVYVEGRQHGDKSLAELCALCRLRELNLIDTGVTDAGLRAVGGLAQLRHLELDGLAVTDAGVRQLRGLRDLKFLSLAGTWNSSPTPACGSWPGWRT